MLRKTLIPTAAFLAGIALAAAATAAETASLRGTIVSAADRAPIAGAIVNVYRGADTQSAATATTDRNGDFYMIGLAPGTYSMQIARPMYQTVILNDLRLNAGKQMRLKDSIAMVTAADALPASQISGCTSLLQPGQTADVYVVCSAPIQGK